MTTNHPLKDLVIVVTGASAGIGAAIARQASAAGARVALSARRDKELQDISAKCPQSLAIVADVTQRSDVERLSAEVIAHYGHYDVWINNVGRGISCLPSELTDADIDEMVDINVKSALYGMQVSASHMKERGDGQIVNVSSELGRVPLVVPRTAYSGAKHFLNALTEGFRSELASAHPGITVTTVSPGLTYTDFHTGALHGGGDGRSIPGGQGPEQVARVVLHAIETRALDMYTREGAKGKMLDYLGHLTSDPPPAA